MIGLVYTFINSQINKMEFSSTWSWSWRDPQELQVGENYWDSAKMEAKANDSEILLIIIQM